MALLELDSLSLLRGNQPVVNDLSFSVDAGEIVGLIGPNGAGKSSTIGGILGFDPIHKGTIQVQECTVTNKLSLSAEAKSRIAYIPEQPMYYSGPDTYGTLRVETKIVADLPSGRQHKDAA